MPDFEVPLTPATLGSMNDRLDPAVHREGMATELRDLDLRRGLFEHRLGWAKINKHWQLPCNGIIGGCAFRNNVGVLHHLVAGDDGKLYHGIGERPSGFPYFVPGVFPPAPNWWEEVSVYADVAPIWDETYQAKFAKWGEDIFVAFSQPREVAVIPPAGTQNLRYRSTAPTPTYAGAVGVAFGVSLARPAWPPAVQMTAADAGVGTILPATLDYKVTFLDVDTGWPSDESDVTSIILPAPPTPNGMITAILQNIGAGNIAFGRYEYFYTFYQPATGIESAPSAITTQTIRVADTPANIQLTTIETCKDAGIWQRRIYRRDNGGGGEGYDGFRVLTTLANNTVTGYVDNTAAVAGSAYVRRGRQVNLTNIPLYHGGLTWSGPPISGWTGDTNGRTIHRRIWRSDDGQPYRLLTEITNNGIGWTYIDNTAAVTGEVYVQRRAIPAMGYVERRGGGIVWAHDRQNVLPANVYIPMSDDEPEAMGVTLLAGTQDDPITAAIEGRGTTLVGKLHAWHRLDPSCGSCDEILTGSGPVSDQAAQYLDTRIPYLSAQGPRLLKLYGESDAPFLGSDSERFCLSEMWRLVRKDRLPYCAGVHWRSAGVVMWGVTLCPTDYTNSITGSARYNDTAIVWDYASMSATNPGGTIYVLSLMGWDCGWVKPGLAAAFDEPWGGFAMGWVGQLFHGKHGDGTDGILEGQVLAVSGNYTVNVDVADLQGENVVGSILYINGGTGTRMCRPVEACENQRALIIGQCGGRLTLMGNLALDATSKFWIGGFPQIIEGMINPQENKKMQRQWDSITVYTVPD